LESFSAKELFAQLEEKNPERAATIDPQNKRRLVRALEIAEADRNVLMNVHKNVPEREHETPPIEKFRHPMSEFGILIIGIETEPAVLRERIAARLHKTLARGLVAETERLLAEGIPHARLSEIGLEYRVVLEHLDGTLPETEMWTKLEQKVWQYARRQMTWLRKMKGVEWFQLEEKEKIEERVREWLG
jgi:tRNA dimethylallyltransferase